MIRPITAMLCLAAASLSSAAPPLLQAEAAPGLTVDSAWGDRKAWADLPSVTLRGIGGAAAPTELRARWNQTAVFFEFLCRDDSVVSPGERDGLDHFKLGDVVEIFLGRTGEPAYSELHATPAGRKTAYAFSGYRKASVPFEGGEVRSGRIEGGWRAVLAIPWKSLKSGSGDGPWEFLAGRYDYDEPGGQPVLSSFPAQTGKPDFHARERYARLMLRP